MTPTVHFASLLIVGTLGVLAGAGLGQLALSYGTRARLVHAFQAVVLVSGSTMGFTIGLNGLVSSSKGFIGGVVLLVVTAMVVIELADRLGRHVRNRMAVHIVGETTGSR